MRLDEARRLFKPPLSLWEIILATIRRELPKHDIRRENGRTARVVTVVKPADVVAFAKKRGLRLL